MPPGRAMAGALSGAYPSNHEEAHHQSQRTRKQTMKPRRCQTSISAPETPFRRANLNRRSNFRTTWAGGQHENMIVPCMVRDLDMFRLNLSKTQQPRQIKWMRSAR